MRATINERTGILESPIQLKGRMDFTQAECKHSRKDNGTCWKWVCSVLDNETHGIRRESHLGSDEIMLDLFQRFALGLWQPEDDKN